jgi:DNA-binding transcriptional MerR regulator
MVKPGVSGRDGDSTPCPSKLYYSIGEVAAMFGVNPSLIRFWEKEFDIISPRKNDRGTRLFTQEDIDRIALIHHYVKERRLTLEGARRKIRENRDDAEHTFQIVQSLKKIRAMLQEIKENLEGTG